MHYQTMSQMVNALVGSVIFTVFLLWPSLTTAVTYNVIRLGAKPDGRIDSSKPFLSAWKAACSSPGQTEIYVPPGQYLLSKPLVFDGKCKGGPTTIRIDGTLVAPTDYRIIGGSGHWISFSGVSHVSLFGGTLDARGTRLWACKASHARCPTGATSLGFTDSDNIMVSGLTSVNSQKFHIVIKRCSKVKLHQVKVSALGDSPNTDGIHVELSTDVTVLASNIETGDDCISIGPGTANLWIENVLCGPGHGISIGSLGRELNEAGVRNVTVKSVTLKETQNGLRIKTWAKKSKGFVRDILFQDATMVNAHNPVIIDQNYCPRHHDCPREASGVTVSGVKYENIHGTSADVTGVKLDCSSVRPCRNIIMEGVRLTYRNRPAEASYAHVVGRAK